MIFETENQFNCLLLFFSFGIIWGIIYFIFSRIIFKEKKNNIETIKNKKIKKCNLFILKIKKLSKKIKKINFYTIFCAFFSIFFAILIIFFNFGEFSITLLASQIFGFYLSLRLLKKKS